MIKCNIERYIRTPQKKVKSLVQDLIPTLAKNNVKRLEQDCFISALKQKPSLHNAKPDLPENSILAKSVMKKTLALFYSIYTFHPGEISVEQLSKVLDQTHYAARLLENKIEDPVISKAINSKLLEMRSPGFRYNITDAFGLREVDVITKLAEIELSAKNKIYPIVGESFKYTKLSKEKNISHEFVLKDIADTDTEIGKGFRSGSAKQFANEMQLDSLKAFIKNHSKLGETSSLLNYLYETYYLSRLSPETKKICKKISDEFNIKLFIQDDSTRAAKDVYEELSEWDRCSEGRFKDAFIPSINLTEYESHYLKNQKSYGYIQIRTNSIHLKSENEKTLSNYLRHEFTHAVDTCPSCIAT